SFLSSVKTEARQSMAHILGIVSTSSLSNNPSRIESLHNLLRSLEGTLSKSSSQLKPLNTKSVELIDGSTLALGYILGRLLYRHPSDFEAYVPNDLLKSCVTVILDRLNSNHQTVIRGACVSIAEIGRYSNLLSKLLQNEAKIIENDSVDYIISWTIPALLKKLQTLAENNKDVRLQEAAIFALGHIAIGNFMRTKSDEFSIAERVIEYFFTLPEKLNKQVEVHFSIGEAICGVIGRWEASCVAEYLDIADVPIPSLSEISSKVDLDVEKVLDRCFDFISSSKPAGRKGICVWLLCLVKYLGNSTIIKNSLPKVHTAFSSLLVDRDDFTQEVASKGIGLVYELGDKSMKEELVRSLVSTFTEGKKLAPQSITAETTLFDSNTLGNTPEGTNITTYQSILSLAADLNQPDLVYRFMNIASHHAIWNSRRGASFGLHSIVALSRDQLLPFLPQLIPRLFRFQYDPNPKVAESMKNIWRALITEDTISISTSGSDTTSSGLSQAPSSGARKIIDDYFDAIIKDLLNAMSDLLDDIKESVRNAAFLACKTLTNITVRYCDPTVVSEKEGQKIVNIILPFFM
ncbi:hypothetical protein HK096_006642, partial [Nowakowskiella sp. JEL0078]